MKRTNLRNGIKQRINEIIGTDEGTEGSIPGLTSWSVQADMIENTRRVVRGIAGGDGTTGRPMKGLWMEIGPLTFGFAGSFSISEGIGFTGNGDIIVFDSSVSIAVELGDSGTRYVYIKHEMAVVDFDSYPLQGKKTSFIRKAGQENIVYDDKSINSDVTIKRSLIVQSSTQIIDGDHVFVGKMNVVGGSVIDSVTPSDIRGFAPNQNVVGEMLVPGIRSTGDVIVEGEIKAKTIGKEDSVSEIVVKDDIKFNSGITINFDSDIKSAGLSAVKDEVIPSGYSLVVKNGIIVGSVPPP